MLATEFSPWLLRAFAFAWGACWGSFFNVAIYRWPRGMSVVKPASHCPGCGEPIKAHHNLPMVGWLMLRGRAACCGTQISPRYAGVELLTALLAVAVVERVMLRSGDEMSLATGLFEALVYFFFVGGLLVATFVDLEWMEIPDEVSLPGAALGLVTAPFRIYPGPAACALGAGAGYLLVQVVFVWTYEHLTGRRGMGEGDSKLLLMIGAFLGLKGVIFALVAGSLQGLIYFVFAMATGRALKPEIKPREFDGEIYEPEEEAEPEHAGQLKLPFGPFLALAGIEFLFFGEELLAWYFNVLR